jgi:hypothetical protein
MTARRPYRPFVVILISSEAPRCGYIIVYVGYYQLERKKS